MIRMAALVVVLAGSLAFAQSKKKEPPVGERIEDAVESTLSGVAEPSEKATWPRFAFTPSAFAVSPTSRDDAAGSGLSDVPIAWKGKTTAGVSADGTAAWLAADIAQFAVCGEGRCYKEKPTQYSDWYHVTALYESTGTKPVAWHIGQPISGKDQKAAMAKAPVLDAIPKKIEAGAEDVVKLFESTIGDPKAFAKTVSDRKDVVLYGSDLPERYVGGGTVKKQLEKWNLAMKPAGGIQAGVTTSKTVAWVAAHVDALPAKNPKAKATPYRLLAIYERTGIASAMSTSASWRLVNAHFSFTSN